MWGGDSVGHTGWTMSALADFLPPVGSDPEDVLEAFAAWAAESGLIWISHGDYVPWRGLTVATLMVPALIANDAERQGWERTAWGTTLTSIGVYAVGSAVGALAAWGGWL